MESRKERKSQRSLLRKWSLGKAKEKSERRKARRRRQKRIEATQKKLANDKMRLMLEVCNVAAWSSN
jgi:hypothetical protein